MKKRGQFWYSDFMIGVIIMITIGLLFFSTIVRLYESNDKIDELINDGVLISDYFMSPGYLPEQWGGKEGRIGFVENGKIIDDNLDDFKELVSIEEGYVDSKYLLGTSFEYVFYFENNEGDVKNDGFIGFLEVNNKEDITNMDTDHMVRLIRFVHYGDDIYKMVVVLWG